MTTLLTFYIIGFICVCLVLYKIPELTKSVIHIYEVKPVHLVLAIILYPLSLGLLFLIILWESVGLLLPGKKK